MACELEPPGAGRMLRCHQDQKIKSDHGRRQYDRQTDDGFDDDRRAEAGGVEPLSDGESDEAEQECRHACEFEREPQRLPQFGRKMIRDPRCVGHSAHFGRMKPYASKTDRAAGLFKNARYSAAAALLAPFFVITAACSSRGYSAEGIS